MSLQTVLIILLFSPVIIGVLAALFDNNTATPIIIDYGINSVVNTSTDFEVEEVVLDDQEQHNDINNIVKYLQPTDIPKELDRSIAELFKAIQMPPEDSKNYTEYSTNSSIEEFVENMREDLPLPLNEYLALHKKYGDIVDSVTTTPAIGGNGSYDCMIGKVSKKGNLILLRYGEHQIPLKGMNARDEGVYIVQGMFVKPDLFFVNNYRELTEQGALNKVAGN